MGVWTLADFERACKEAGIDWQDVAIDPPPYVMPEKNGKDMRTPLVLQLTVYKRNSQGKRYVNMVTQEAAVEVRRIPFYTVRPSMVPHQTDMFCRWHMGDGVFCQRPLTMHYDPVGWTCGWGHVWWPMGSGRIAGIPLYAPADAKFKFPPQIIRGTSFKDAAERLKESMYRLGEAMSG